MGATFKALLATAVLSHERLHGASCIRQIGHQASLAAAWWTPALAFGWRLGDAEERNPAVGGSCSDKCATDLDCSLNGECHAGACACHSGWRGPCCAQLDLLPVDYAAHGGGFMHPSISSWGGNIVADKGQYHMWLSEWAPGADGKGGCGLLTWVTNSQLTHVVSNSLEGPYQRRENVVPPWASNPQTIRAPDGALVMFHTGFCDQPAGTGGSQSCQWSGRNRTACAENGTTPCGAAASQGGGMGAACGHWRCDTQNGTCLGGQLGDGPYENKSSCESACIPPKPGPPPPPSPPKPPGPSPPGPAPAARACEQAGTIPGFVCHSGYCSGGGGQCDETLGEGSVVCNKTWADCAPKLASACTYYAFPVKIVEKISTHLEK